MKTRNIRVSRRAEKALLSETLPFEIPVTFSNRNIYAFTIKHMLTVSDGLLSWKKSDVCLDYQIKLLCGISVDANVATIQRQIGPNLVPFRCVKLPDQDMATKPFEFRIQHKLDAYRSLAIPHIRSQFWLVDFYKKYKETIIYHAGGESFSLRKPVKVASHSYFSDKLFLNRFDKGYDAIETYEKEYENLRSFFVYKKYSNIYKFYESYEFHRNEQNFDKLLKLDISKCFDSIYTHSISWAHYGKAKVKQQFLEPERRPTKGTFPDRFDQLMQMMNGRETNGIIIGPEVSRIFAELILTSIDRAVLRSAKASLNLNSHKKDFEICRYIDDYFIFFNDDNVRDVLVELLHKELKEYKLHLGSEKSKEYSKPIITEMTIAKNRIAALLDERIGYKKTLSDSGEITYRLFLKSPTFITAFKTIIHECKVEYKDVLNWTLALIEQKVVKTFKKYSGFENPEDRKPEEVIRFIINLLEFAFFIYSVTPRVNTTLRLCRILTIVRRFVIAKISDVGLRHSVDGMVFHNIQFLLFKFKHHETTPVESLYLLIQLSEIGNEFRLSEQSICEYFGVPLTNWDCKELDGKLNYFSVTVLLFYLKNDSRYHELKAQLEKFIFYKVCGSGGFSSWDTESNMLLMDCLACPYLTIVLKRKLLREVGITSGYARKKILASNAQWFTAWENFDYVKALDAKKSFEVY